MRRLIAALCGCLGALSGCEDAAPSRALDDPSSDAPGWRVAPAGDLNEFFDCLEADGVALVSAHRGGPQPGFPENAVETMAAVLARIPAIMEVDVATSSDGVLFLLHDDDLDRTTTGSGPANGFDWGAISALRLVDNQGRETGFAPSRFDDALAWAAGRTILQIDFKRSTRFEDAIAEIDRQGAEDRVILIAYTLAAAQKLHALAPDVMISLSVDSQSELNRAVAAGVPAERLVGFTGTAAPRPRLFRTLNERDVEVIFGTLGGRGSIDREIAASGDEAFYAEIAEEGADILATDRPFAAQASLAAAGRAVEAGECGVERR